ncbi:hypothetical protein AB0I55_06510 [Actinocatenispora sera]|uniref:Polyketide cyclase/dehydrase/lipid transport protein n=1 Tax=Actinocatenispora sera TaxID=390989 RepID=A0A810LAC7_9ACTN|nr:hypothetical protein [Actinocatenispora sera]BCJ32233.1 hypothetical protein Asera_63410 [Actinocatenispora sera]
MNRPHPAWPVAELDDLRRLRAVHAAYPGSRLTETNLPVPFAESWPVLSDLEREFPALVPDIRRLRVLAADGERLQVHVLGRSGLRGRFDAVLRDGWCLMRNRFLVFGMAAVPDGEYTRVGYLAGNVLPGNRLLAPLLAPARRRIGRRVTANLHRRFS